MANKKKIVIIFLLTLTIIFTLACYGFYDAGSTERDSHADITDFPRLEIYSFNPEINLKTLEQGDASILTLSSVVTPVEYVSLSRPAVRSVSNLWKYSEYMEFAGLIQRQTWQDDAKLEWNLNIISFDVDCQDPLDGFSNLDLFYFRTSDVDGESKYVARELLISPLYGNVVSGSGASYPKPLFYDWKGTDLINLKITPDKALQIAEENGGKKFRDAHKNNCHVYETKDLSVGGEGWGWDISYVSKKDQLDKFEVNVDPYTGKFKTQTLGRK